MPRSEATPRPIQARSRARVEAILDAAEEVFLETGFARATTNHVAARAGTSIGALYRFFPNKEALLVALADRYRARLTEVLGAIARDRGAGKAPTLREALEHGIDTFHAFLVAHPGFATLIEQRDHPALREGNRAHDEIMGAGFGALYDACVHGRPAIERDAMVEVTVSVLGHLQMLSFARDGAFRARVIAEAKILVVAYLSARLGLDPSIVIGAAPAPTPPLRPKKKR